MIAVVAIYSHPEFYPPTLNAVQALSTKYDKIYLLCNNVVETNWDYPLNVELVAIGGFLPVKVFENKSILWKLRRFLTYFKKLNELARTASLILTYDTIPLMAYGLGFRYLLKKHPIWWYHNHDIADLAQIRKGSIGWFAVKMEPFFFRWLDIFSLPAEERKTSFPINKLNGKYFFLPNYPSVNVYGKIPAPPFPQNEVKLIYQGSISPGHGLETIITILGPNKKNTITLTLIGRISTTYKETLEALAEKEQTGKWLFIQSAVGYKSLPYITSKHHIGLAIHEPKGIIYATGGTASNKIYEYAACGLPIIYLDTPHYNEYLQNYDWAKSVNLEKDSIIRAIDSILKTYENLSQLAKFDFIEIKNYEHKIDLLMKQLNDFYQVSDTTSECQ